MAKATIVAAWITAAGAVVAGLIPVCESILSSSRSDPGRTSATTSAPGVTPGTTSTSASPTGGRSPSTQTAGDTGSSSTDNPTSDAQPPPETSFVGVVINANNNLPIANAAVTLLGRAGDAVTTNPSGCFTLTLMQLKGASSLFVAAAGYQSHSFDMDLATAPSKDYEFSLQPLSVNGSTPSPVANKATALKISPEIRRRLILGTRPVVPFNAIVEKNLSFIRK